jgi:hypothetical protein
VVDANKAWVLEQHLYDGAGTLLASAVAKSHRYLPETGVSLPQVIEIHVPPAELAMTIDVGTVEVNRLADNPQMWALPTIPGSPAVDLGAQPPQAPGGGAPTMGAQINGANWYDPGPPVGAPQPAVSVSESQFAAAATTPQFGGGPTPQFVPPGGVAMPTADPFESRAAPALSAQRLPTGGVAAPAFTR